jgi:hypothetical protein
MLMLIMHRNPTMMTDTCTLQALDLQTHEPLDSESPYQKPMFATCNERACHPGGSSLVRPQPRIITGFTAKDWGMSRCIDVNLCGIFQGYPHVFVSNAVTSISLKPCSGHYLAAA